MYIPSASLPFGSFFLELLLLRSVFSSAIVSRAGAPTLRRLPLRTTLGVQLSRAEVSFPYTFSVRFLTSFSAFYSIVT
jgi:hypothetical protein